MSHIVDGHERSRVHQKQSIAGGFQLDLALFHLAAIHVRIGTQGIQPLSGIVFMKRSGRHFPDVQVLLAHREEYGDICLHYHMALAEPGVLILALDDLGEVVAEHMAYGLLCFNEFHALSPKLQLRLRPGRHPLSPPRQRSLP